MGLAGGGHCRHGAPVEGVESGDDFVCAVPVQLSITPGQLQRTLISLCAAVAEEDLVQTTVFYQRLSQLQLRHGIELVGSLQQRARLLRDGLGNHGMTVAQVVHGPTGDEIQIFLTVGIPHSSAFASDDDDGLPPDRLGVIFLLYRYPITTARHGRLPPCVS